MATCGVCRELFDAGAHRPRVLRACGHSVCAACLTQLCGANAPHVRCPFDRAPSDAPFPDNWAVLEQLRGLFRGVRARSWAVAHASGVAVSAAGEVFVTCGSNIVRVFRSDGSPVRSWRTAETAHEVRVFHETVYVVVGSEVHVFRTDGAFQRALQGFMKQPSITVSALGVLIVCDHMNVHFYSHGSESPPRVLVLSDSVFTNGFPVALASSTDETQLYVIESFGNHVRMLSALDGSIIRSLGDAANDNVESSANDIAVSSIGDVLVVEEECVRVLRADGSTLVIYEGLEEPRAIAVSTTGEVFVADVDRGCIQVFV